MMGYQEFSMKHLMLLSLIVIVGCKQPSSGGFDYPYRELPATPTFSNIAASDSIQDPSIDPFIQEHENNKANYSVQGSDKITYYKFDISMDAKILGQCVSYADANLIKINPVFWATASVWDKRAVVLHELGHCDLGRGHRSYYWVGPRAIYDGGIKPNWGSSTRFLSDGVTPNPNYRGEWPISLMHSSVVRQSRFSVESNYYIFELYHQGLQEDPGFGGNLESDCVAHYGLDGHVHFD